MLKKTLLAATVAAFAALAVAGSASSGLNVGETVTPFHPKHLSGPDKGTDTCPPCKYGNLPAVQVWVNHDSAENVGKIADVLAAEVGDSKANLKAFVINLTMCEKCEEKANTMAKTTKHDNIAIAMLPVKDEAVKNYKVNTDSSVKNTVFVYRNRKVVAKFVNLEANAKGLGELRAAIAKAEK